jgi:hypothetical protein
MENTFDEMYVNVKTNMKTYEILSFTHLPLTVIQNFYSKINNIEEFVEEGLNIIHLTLKKPTEFNQLKTSMTFEELHTFYETWVFNSIVYSEYMKGNIDDNGDNLKTPLTRMVKNLIKKMETKTATNEETHIFFIRQLSEEIKYHAKKINKIKQGKKTINKITIEVENDSTV